MSSEREYIERVCQGDDEAFAVLYEQCRAPFFGYFRSTFRKCEDYVEDLYQDACVIVWQQILSGRFVAAEDGGGAQLKTYIIGVGRHLMLSRDRQAFSLQSLPEPPVLERILSLNASVNNLRQEEEQAVGQIVGEMKEPCNSLLFMSYWAKMRGEEIASVLGYSDANSVKTQKYKCMKKLKLAVLKIIRS